MDKGKENRIAVLNAAQEQRKQNCLEKTEKAIAQLSQTNQRLSFANLARVAGVSISYLYKYPELKERVQSLRKQHEQAAKALQPPPRSEKSSQVIIGQLRERIKSLEWEKKELKKQNEALTGRLYFMGNTQDLIERLKADHSKLKTENEQLREKLESTRKELDVQREANMMKSTIAEWYDLARNSGIVIGYREEDGVMMVQENTGHWHLFEEFSAKWTLKSLKRRLHDR